MSPVVGAYCNTPLRQRFLQAWILAGVLLLSFSATPGIAQAEKVRAERYEIDVSFQPEKGFLHARAAVTLRAARYLKDIEFELNPHLKILEVTDQQARKLDFTRSQRLGSPKLSLRLAEPAVAGGAEQAVTLTFTYEGVLPQKPLDYITKHGILLRDESRWYPAVDLSAFTQNNLTITLPRGWRAVTSGDPMDLALIEPMETRHWKTSRPVSSRSLVAYPQKDWGTCASLEATPSDPVAAPRWIAVCVPSQRQESAVALARKVRELFLKYGGAFGSYADKGFAIVQGFPGQRGAIGYSAPGFLVVSEDVVKYHDYPGYAPEFLPHEIAHQWFPIEITLASEADGWLAESLAEYLSWPYLAEKSPEQARLLVARAMRDALAPDPLRPLSLGLKLFAREDPDVTHATLYQRGMLVWRTLETVIDRERVDRALKEYYARYAGRPASIADFRKICEEISGRDLGWFFDYFIAGTRIPEIEIHRTPSAAPNEFAGEIVLKNVPPDFQVRVEMRLYTAAGPFDHSVATRSEATPFTVPTPQPVIRVTLDPDQRTLRWTEAARRNRSQRALLSQLDAGAYDRAPLRAGAPELARAVELYRKALALDPDNLASNEQPIRFALGHLLYRQGHPAVAFREFEKVLSVSSLDPMERDFNRAWARVYRARIEKRRGRPAAARAEAQAGLAMKSPALQMQVTLPETPERATTAAAELRTLAR